MSRVISRTFDVNETQTGDDDEADEEIDALLESASQAQATASIAWSNRGDTTVDISIF